MSKYRNYRTQILQSLAIHKITLQKTKINRKFVAKDCCTLQITFELLSRYKSFHFYRAHSRQVVYGRIDNGAVLMLTTLPVSGSGDLYEYFNQTLTVNKATNKAIFTLNGEAFNEHQCHFPYKPKWGILSFNGYGDVFEYRNAAMKFI